MSVNIIDSTLAFLSGITVRHPGGLSLVIGGGAFGLGGNSVQDLQWIISLTGLTSVTAGSAPAAAAAAISPGSGVIIGAAIMP